MPEQRAGPRIRPNVTLTTKSSWSLWFACFNRNKRKVKDELEVDLGDGSMHMLQNECFELKDNQ